MTEDSGTEIGKDAVLYKTTSGIREYALTRGENTNDFIEGVVIAASARVAELAAQKHNDPKDNIGPAIAAVATEHMSSGLSIPRVLLGGNYPLEEVMSAVSCIDASTLVSTVAQEGFGQKAEIRKTRLGVVPNHHFVVLEDGSIIDPVLQGKRNPGGYFKNEAIFRKRLDSVNSLGVKGMVRQIRNLVRPQSSEATNERQIVVEAQPAAANLSDQTESISPTALSDAAKTASQEQAWQAAQKLGWTKEHFTIWWNNTENAS